ncbi:MAG: 50S ribosomal protein L5 [Candidatus Altiarchaeales archaeon WOR_SM1_86-2]|nr:MAG: 50S ribosomal protein L5 [Candidatus Altiarchaeales archaeon WOR_SM1_86-2]
MEYTNPMQAPRIEKVTVHVGVGESGERLIKAEQLLAKLTGRKPVRTVSTHRIPAWGIRKGTPIGAKVTLRKNDANEFLRKAFHAKSTIKKSSFDKFGNFSFGIQEYIDFPDMKYDPDIGIFGMDICVTLERKGFRIKHRKLKNTGDSGLRGHHLSKDEAISFIKENFKVEIE